MFLDSLSGCVLNGGKVPPGYVLYSGTVPPGVFYTAGPSLQGVFLSVKTLTVNISIFSPLCPLMTDPKGDETF